MRRHMHNAPIWAKFCAAWGVLLICVVWLGANSYSMLERLEGGLSRLSTLHLPTQQGVFDLTQSAMTTHVKVSRYVTWASGGASTSVLRPLRDEVTAELESYNSRLRLLMKHLDLRQFERATATPLLAKWDRYLQSVKDTVDVAGADPAFATMMLGATDEDFEGFASALQYISVLVTQETQTASQGRERRSRRRQQESSWNGVP